MSKVQRPYSDIHKRLSEQFTEWEIEQAIAVIRQELTGGAAVYGKRSFDWQTVQQFCMEHFVRQKQPQPTPQENQEPAMIARPARELLAGLPAPPPVPILSEFQQALQKRIERIRAGAGAHEAKHAAGYARNAELSKRYPDFNYFKESNQYE